MKQLKALVIKEWRTHRNALLTPLWFTLGVYAVSLLGYVLSLVKGGHMDFNMALGKIPPGMGNFLMYSSIYAGVVMLGTVGIISAIILADSMINGGFKRKCEILHLSQPVSVIKIISVKYLMLSLGTIVLLGVIGLLNTLLFGFIQSFYTAIPIYFGLVAWAQASIEISLSLLMMASIYWFFAGLYTRKSFFLGTLTILGIQAAISILNYTAGLEIPSLLGYLARLSSVQVNLSHTPNPVGIPDVFSLINGKWAQLMGWDSVIKLAYSAMLFAGGFFLYKRKELN